MSAAPSLRSVDACPLCDHRASHEIFSADSQPATLNFLYATAGEARLARRADLRFLGCDACGFVWNAAFDASRVHYAPGYVNDQSHSPAFRTHLDHVRARLTRALDGREGDVLEIGCGQGGFLSALCAQTGRSGVGFDPACASTAGRGATVDIHRAMFSADAARASRRHFALICCRHVIEHLPDPAAFVREVASLAQGSRTSRPMLYLEVPCFEWIASHAAFFDLFHEHCSLFTARSIWRMLRSAGFGPIRIHRGFAGQYLCVLAEWKAGAQTCGRESSPACDLAAAACALRDARDAWAGALDAELAQRPCIIWGAGAKGVSLVNHLHLDATRLPLMIDIHPQKRGRYVAITAQRVIAAADIAGAFDEPPAILLMNPNYAPEVRRLLREQGVPANLRVFDRGPRVALHR